MKKLRRTSKKKVQQIRKENIEQRFMRLMRDLFNVISISPSTHITYRRRYSPPLMSGLCPGPLWSIRYQLYMDEFPHSDVLKIIQTFLCWNWNINILAAGCLLKGWKVQALLCLASSQPKWDARSTDRAPVLVISSPLFDSYHQISSADSPCAPSLLLLFLFEFFHVHFQIPWRRKSGFSVRNNKPWFIYHAACLKLFSACLCVFASTLTTCISEKQTLTIPSKSRR